MARHCDTFTLFVKDAGNPLRADFEGGSNPKPGKSRGLGRLAADALPVALLDLEYVLVYASDFTR